ncbi:MULTISPECIES: signal peptidase I SipW [Sutcliffiella]|uniref:Signal peptidase I n=1 Tax=Sutcliffiella cohnii TaxID=33932 RepID=A0A223KV72_9BACI|nr:MULTISPECIES: signal peptidase I [Sutcliffiella]AST93238.1 signal peptidase I [Sutcliffiella cohnii]WBL14418.1 signal peptidase I [Sutcliffiella sp. NC1]
MNQVKDKLKSLFSLKNIKKWFSSLVTFTLFATLILMAVLVISSKAAGGEPQVLGYQLKTVLSGSMEPEIKTGSVIAVKPDVDMKGFEKGDIITFKADTEKLITHRITEVVTSGEHVMYRTKGDSNNAEDSAPVLSENVVAQYTGFTIPYAGYFINFANSKNGSLLLMVLPGILLVLYAGLTIKSAINEIEKNSKQLTVPIEDTPPKV